MKKLLAILLAVTFAGVSFHALADDMDKGGAKKEASKDKDKMKGHKGGKKDKGGKDKGGAMKDDKGGAMKDDKGGK